MFGRIRSKGLKISAELHEKIAACGEPINAVDSEIMAIRPVRRKSVRKAVVSREFKCVHVYCS